MSARATPAGRPRGSSAASAAADAEDLTAASSPARVSPRRQTDSPYTRLRQLAGATQKPSTPLRRQRTPSAGPASAPRRTPSAKTPGQARTPGVSAARPGRLVSAKQGAPATPHALRALRERRAAAAARETPGREQRRRSGRQLRETPRDILRALSRLESRRSPRRSSAAAVPSARASLRRAQEDSDDEDEPRPETTVPLDEDDDDDSFQAPPRLSQTFDDDLTQISIEGPRRDHADLGRFARESMRLSDRFGDANELDAAGDAQDDDGYSINVDDYGGLDEDAFSGGENDDLRNLLSARRQSLGGDASLMAAGDAENSFALDIPGGADFDDSADSDDGFPDPGQATDTFDPPRTSALSADMSAQRGSAVRAGQSKTKPMKVAKRSRYGVEYPSLPAAMLKKMTASALRAAGSGKTKVSREILVAITQASDMFFEQMSEDAAAYADHARRKTIDESDVLTLMRRQRVLNASTTPFSLAQKHLPRELLQDIRMPPPPKTSGPVKRKRQALQTVEEEYSE